MPQNLPFRKVRCSLFKMAAKRVNRAREDWYQLSDFPEVISAKYFFLAAILNRSGSFRSAVAMTSVTEENGKRELEEAEREEHASNAKRNKSEPLNLLWKFW